MQTSQKVLTIRRSLTRHQPAVTELERLPPRRVDAVAADVVTRAVLCPRVQARRSTIALMYTCTTQWPPR